MLYKNIFITRPLPYWCSPKFLPRSAQLVTAATTSDTDLTTTQANKSGTISGASKPTLDHIDESLHDDISTESPGEKVSLHQGMISQRWRVGFAVALLTLCAALSPVAKSDTILIHPRPESDFDQRYQYDWTVLRMAMEKTRAAFGAYEIREATDKMGQSRVEYEMETPGGRVNVFVRSSSIDLEKRFLPIRIPVDRGIIGYRILLVRTTDLVKLAAVRNLDDLRKFRFGQGKGWADVNILKTAGFHIVEGDSYDGLFAMLTAERFDVFCRSISEALSEYDAQHSVHPEIAIEPTLLLHYPLPRYFFVRRDAEGQQFAKRIESGLEMMIRDGSLADLFFQFKGDQIKRAKLDKRLILNIPNPLLPPETPLNRSELWYDPLNPDKR